MKGDDEAHGPLGDGAGAGLDGLDASRSEEIFPLVYTELRKIARRLFVRESPGHTLQPTALVHEAYLKLVEQRRADLKSRTHFIAVGAQAMRRLLVDHARRRGASKRGSAQPNVDLMDVIDLTPGSELDFDQILSVHAALERLACFDERQSLIVTLRFFGGLTQEEIAELMDVSVGTVARDWRHARAWLQVEISRMEV